METRAKSDQRALPIERARRQEGTAQAFQDAVDSSLKAFPGLLVQKITIPEPVVGYVHRADLVDRAMPTRRRLTVLKASAGFGKTTLMAECCRRARENGIAAAWVSLDEHDTPGVLDTYIAVACTRAGLDLHDAVRMEGSAGGPGPRIGAVVGAIQSLGTSFVIAFDELERLAHRESASLLAFLLERGPPNLHLVFACREMPDGIDAASVLLDGRAEVIETADLRFSRADVARFFALGLSRRALAAVADRSAGWPFALRVCLNEKQRGAAQDLAKNWIESRLFADLGRDEREFVLDLGLFDWFDAEMLNEVLERTDSMRRFESLGVLEGLVERVQSGNWRLHALVREHCAGRRLREDPKRFHDINRRIAGALARRGQTVQAMRHAIDGNDPSLAGEILQRAGGVRLYTRQGAAQLLDANRLLTEDAIARWPRLKLVRCVALMLSGHPSEARTIFAEFDRDCPPGDCSDADFERYTDIRFVHGCIAVFGAEPLGGDWSRAVLGDARLASSPRLDPATRGNFEYALSVRQFLKGEFDSSLEHLSAARELLSGTHFIECYGELLRGQVDFVKGRVRDAESCFARARRVARRHFVVDPVAVTACGVPLGELRLECDPSSNVVAPAGVLRTLKRVGVPYSYFATAIKVLVDTRLRIGHIEDALALTDELLAQVRSTGLTGFLRLVVALRISVLVTAGRVRDAERLWRSEDFPEKATACVDLEFQTLREMEAVSDARVRLLIAAKQYDQARRLLDELHAFAAKRSFRTIQMRALALSIVLEGQAGDADAGQRHLTEYLSLYAECPYAWPLVRERADCAQALNRFLELHGDSPHGQSARRLLAAMQRLGSGPQPVLTARELDVLRRLPGHTVKQVAAELDLSAHGVRYYLRKLFAKFQVSGRAELLRRAQEMGLTPDNS